MGNEKEGMKTSTIVGIVIVIIMILASFITIFLMQKKAGGQKVVVKVDGVTYGSYDLYENQTVDIETEEGSNILVILDGKAFIESSDCPEQICVNTAAISEKYPGIIVCLPHKVIISLE